MGQSEVPFAQSNMGDPPLLFKFLVGLGTLTSIAADPNVFEEYFDDGMKLVDVSQDIALRSCLSNGNTADQTKTIYDKCYGEDFNFDDLAQSGSSDSDGMVFLTILKERRLVFTREWGGCLMIMNLMRRRSR